MEKEVPTCAISPKCSVGTQHGEGLESLDEYKVAFDFAKNHGYGFVEFVDVTHVSRSKKKKKRNRAMPVRDCMYATSHHLQKETFSVKYQSKSNSILNERSRRFCATTDVKKTNELSDLNKSIDIVEKIKDTIARMEIDSSEKSLNKGHTDTNSKKRKSAENSYRKKINEKYGRQESSDETAEPGSLETNEICEERSQESCARDNHDADKEDDQSTTCDVTFNTWNEYDTPKPSSVQNNNNDSIDLRVKDKYTKNEDDIYDIHKNEDETGLDGNECDNNTIRMSKGRQNSFWERLRRNNPFKSMSCTLKIFKKCHSPCAIPKQSRSLKVEKIKIKRVEYIVNEGGSKNDVQNVPNQIDGEEKETAFSLNSGLIRFRPLEETDKKLSNTSRCRPKPKTLRNSNVRRLFQMCGGERRFFSSTNLTKDDKEHQSTISHENYHDATSGDFTQRLSEGDPNRTQMPTPTKTANAHGDVVVSSATNKGIALISHPLGEQTLPYGFVQTGNTFDGNKAHVNALLTQMEQNSGKNNNKSETTVDFFHNGLKTRNTSFSRTEDSVETQTEPDSILLEEANFDKRTEVTDDENNDVDLQESNCNNNADDEEKEHAPDDNDAQNSLNTNVDNFQDIQNFNPRATSRTVFGIDNDNNFEHTLENELTCLVSEQDTDADDHLACGSYSLDPLSASENDPYFNQNSSKIIQKDHGRPSGRHCVPPTDISNRSYVLSSPGRPEARESDTVDHEENETISNVNIHDQCLSPGEQNRQDEMECSEAGYPPINMHQRNMVYCPTTENYWAPTPSYPRLTNVGTGRNDQHHDPNSLRMFADPTMHMEDEREGDESIDFYRLVDSCIAETENKLSQRLEDMYGSVNERLSSLEALVKKKFDKTLSMIENLKKQNMNRSMNKIDRENERASEAIHLNTEATKSSIPEIFSVKNLGNLIQNDDVSSDGTTNMHKTFPTIAFSEVTPNNNHLHPTHSQENADGNEGTSVLESRALESEKSKKKHYTQEQNTGKYQIKNKERKNNKYRKDGIKKKKVKSKQNYSKNKSRSCKKSKKTNPIQLRSGNSIFPDQYLRRQHSRKCRLRQHMTGENSCNVCMGTSKKHGANGCKGKDDNAQKTVHWLSDDTVKDGNRREYRRSPHPRVVRMFQNTKKRYRVAEAEKQVSQRKQPGGTNKRRQKRDESKRKKRNIKKIVSWSEIVFKKDRTGKKYRRSPHSRVVKRHHGINRSRSPQTKKETKYVSSGRKSKRKKCEKTINKSREYFDKSNCSIRNIFGNSSEEKGETESNSDSYGRAYRQLLKENQSLLKEVEVMKQYSSRGRNDMFIMKRKVIEKFNRLLSTCSPKRAHALYCILFPREKTHNESYPGSYFFLTNNSKSSIEDEKNNNKCLGVTKTEGFNETRGNQSQNVRLDNQSFVRNDVFRHADSLHLIQKGLGWKNKSMNSCQIFDSSFKPPQTPYSIKVEPATSDSSERMYCSHTEVSENAHVLPEFHFKQHHEKQTENNHKAICVNTQGMCESHTNRHSTGNIRLVNWNPGIKNDIKNGLSRDDETNTNAMGATVNCPDQSNISTKSNLSQDVCHGNTDVFRLIYPGNVYIDRQPMYSWSKPIFVNLSDFSEQWDHDMFRRESNNDIDELTVSGGHINNSHVERIQMRQSVLKLNDAEMRPHDLWKKSMTENKNTPNSENISLSKLYSKNELDKDESNSHFMTGHNVPENKGIDSSSCYRNIPTLVLRLVPTNPDTAAEDQSNLEDALTQNTEHSNLNSTTAKDSNSRSALSVAIDLQTETGTSSEYRDSQKRGNYIDSFSGSLDIITTNTNPSIQALDYIPEQSEQSHASSLTITEALIPKSPFRYSVFGSSSQTTPKSNHTDHHNCTDLTGCDDNTHLSDRAGLRGDESMIGINQSSELCFRQGSSLIAEDNDTLANCENLHDQHDRLASFDDRTQPLDHTNNDKTIRFVGSEMSNESEQTGTIGCGELLKSDEQTTCLCLNNTCPAYSHNTISINTNEIPNEASSAALPMTSPEDDCSPNNSKYLLSALKSQPTNDTLCSQKPSTSVEAVISYADDEMSKRECTTRQPYLEVRTPGLSTRWTMSTRSSTDHSDHHSDIPLSGIETEENVCVKTDTTNTNNDNIPSDKNSIASTDNQSCTTKDNSVPQCENQSGQAERDCPECSNNTEKPSFTWSETNNNNVTDNLIIFPSDYQKDGTFILHANDKRQESVTNCRYISYNGKHNCRCCCPHVKSLKTLPFQKLQNVCLLGLPEGGEGCSQEIPSTTRSGVSWWDRGEGPDVSSNPRKRSMTITHDEENYAHAIKRRRKEVQPSSTRRSKIHFRRVRWQLLREIRLRKLSDGSKNQLDTNKFAFASAHLHPPSSDADSESSL